jgi:hypothetical protein
MFKPFLFESFGLRHVSKQIGTYLFFGFWFVIRVFKVIVNPREYGFGFVWALPFRAEVIKDGGGNRC